MRVDILLFVISCHTRMDGVVVGVVVFYTAVPDEFPDQFHIVTKG